MYSIPFKMDSRSEELNKRKRNTPELKLRRAKRNRLNPTRGFRTIVIVSETEPHIYLHKKDSEGCSNIKLGAYIYRVHYVDWIDEDKIGLNLVQYNNLLEYIYDNEIMILEKDISDINNIESVKLRIRSMSLISNTIKLSYEYFLEHIHLNLDEHVLTIGQKFLLNIDSLDLEVKVIFIDTGQNGKLIKNTLMDFIVDMTSDLIIYKQMVTIGRDHLTAQLLSFNMLSVDSSQKSDDPIFIDLLTFSEILRRKLHTLALHSGKIIECDIDNYRINVSLKIDIDSKDLQYPCFFMYDGISSIPIESLNRKIILTTGIGTAQKIYFTVLSYSNSIDQNSIIPVSILQMEIFINFRYKKIVKNQELVVKLGSRECRLQIDLIIPITTLNLNNNSTNIFELDEDTKMIFSADKKASFILVENDIPLPCEKVILQTKEILKSGVVKFLMENEDNKTLLLTEKKIIRLAKLHLPVRIARGQKVKVKSQSKVFNIKVKDLKIHNEVNTKSKYSILGEITKETKFEVQASKTSY